MELLFTNNVLQIPSLFQSPYELMVRIAFVLFSIMFIIATIHENVQAMRGQSDYLGLFVHVLLVISLLILYDRVFTWIAYGMDLLSEAILPHQEFQEVVRAAFREVTDFKDLGFLNLNRYIITGLNYLTYVLALVSLSILTWLRFIFLALLYVLGPVVIAVGVYRETAQGLKFWLKSVIGISLWTVVLAILMKVISVMNLTSVYLTEDTNTLAVVAANILFVVLFISVPLIANLMTAGASLSGLGSALVGVTTAILAKTVTKRLFRPDRGRFNNLNPAGGGGDKNDSGGSTYK